MGQANVFKDIHAKAIILGDSGTNQSMILVKNITYSGIQFGLLSNAGYIILRNATNTRTVNIDGTDGSVIFGDANLNTKAIVACVSTTKGFLPPVMTEAQRDAIAAPTVGLVIFNSTTNKLNVRGAAAWEVVTSV
jgi:hypothetical protein